MAGSTGRRGVLDWGRLARLHDGTAGRPAARVLLAAATALVMVALALAGAASAREPAAIATLANPAIVGGGEISITLAPWQVEVEEVIPVAGGQPLVFICGGSILSSTKVLTAAHCVFNESKQVPAADILVTAGTSDFDKADTTGEAEQVKVSEIRVHPDYAPNPGATEDIPDDVAVLNLERALVPGPSISPIELAPAGSSFLEGTAVDVAGFGEENPLTEELNGTLNSLQMNLVSSHECGGKADALFLCARTATGSVCFGDSGSGLTIPGSPAMPGVPAVPVRLVGVTDTVEDKCADDALAGFANVTAPEIRDFIEGEVPQVASITPTSGPAAGGTVVTIKGSGFLSGATVTIGAAAAEVKFVSSTDLTAKTQAGSGSREVVVSDLGGTSKSGPTFTYAALPPVELPTVASIAPNTGRAAGGTAVTIKGTGFLPGSTVTIGSSAVEVEVVSSTELTAKTPVGSGSPSVVVSDLGGSSKGGPTFTYEAASSPLPPPTEVAVGIAPVLGADTPLPPVGGTTPAHVGGTTGPASSAALVAATIAVQSGSTASVKVACRGIATCRGQLTLTTKSTVQFKGKPTLRTVPIGSASFSVLGGGSKTVKIKLGPVGRALLISDHGRLSARLSIVKVEPAPRQSQVKAVQLVAQRVRSSTR